MNEAKTPMLDQARACLIDSEEYEAIIQGLGKRGKGWTAKDISLIVAWCNEIRISALLLKGFLEGRLRIVGIREGAPLFDVVEEPVSLSGSEAEIDTGGTGASIDAGCETLGQPTRTA